MNYINYINYTKYLFDYCKNNNLIIIFSITAIILISFFLFLLIIIILSYYTFKYLDVNIVNDVYFCNYKYNKKTEELLQKYGEYKINKIYLVKNPLNNFNTFLLNFITFYKYDKELNNLNSIFKKKYIPYHISLIVEISQSNNTTKFVSIEKTSYVNISENINLNQKNIIKKINLSNKNISINSILDKTKNRIGSKKFFNWSIYKNNCYIFIKEILISIDLFNKSNKKFISQNKFVKHIKFSNFTLHIINFLCAVNSIFNNYIFI
jgi:hypothetical protein